ncbi:MAG: NUDIX domain-containing protein [Longispora sp.]|nr:NUDIX domain-containing protein [Longispora sp. (in: high G+C Gram-positive bacteria)]
MALRRVRRIAVYGMCRDDAGRVLMVARTDEPAASDVWNLPGGEIQHGEAPARAIIRQVESETGLVAKIEGLRDIAIEIREHQDRGFVVHSDRIVYDVRIVGGVRGGYGSHRMAWLSADDLRVVRLTDRARAILGMPGPPEELSAMWNPEELGPDQGQRFSAYGVVTDPKGRILLTLISLGYPGAGTWHLPGGGTDFGEDPKDALLRELLEETGQGGEITGLISVTNLHNPAAWGPEGRPMDWHGVRVTYRVRVDDPTDPEVRESNGSTADASWFTEIEAAKLRLNRPALDALRRAGLLPAR